MPALKHEVHLRLRAIELIAHWEGRLITTQLMEWFGITRQQASADINRYNTQFNVQSLVHNAAVKGYVPVTGFCQRVSEHAGKPGRSAYGSGVGGSSGRGNGAIA